MSGVGKGAPPDESLGLDLSRDCIISGLLVVTTLHVWEDGEGGRGVGGRGKGRGRGVTGGGRG